MAIDSTPKDSYATLAVWDMEVLCPPLLCTLLYALILNVNPWLDKVCKSSSYGNLRLVFASN